MERACTAANYLFGPKHDRALCCAVVATEYGREVHGTRVEPLDASKDFWELEHGIDDWFEESQSNVTVSQGQDRAYRRAMRLYRCNAAKPGRP